MVISKLIDKLLELQELHRDDIEVGVWHKDELDDVYYWYELEEINIVEVQKTRHGDYIEREPGKKVVELL